MKKKYQMLAAAGVLSITCLCSAFSVSAESDIAGHWAQETVTKWFEAGKINGYEDGTLRPDSNMTRAEFATLLSNVLRKSGDTGEKVQPYPDVKEGAWFYDSVTKLQALSAIPESEFFYPDEYITREDAMTMAGNAFWVRSFDTSPLETFTDYGEISEYALMAVAGFVDRGIIKGYEDGTIRPSAPITRAECVMMLDGLDIVHERGSLKGIMDRIYEGVDASMPETSYTDITDENAQYFLGLENLNGIDEALASDAVMRPVAHSVCLVRVSDGGDVEAIKEEIRAKVNPAKWICVGVSREDVIVESRGNLILLVMSKAAPQEIAASFSALEL